MKDMPSKSVDIVFTSPPYNLRNNRGKLGSSNAFDGGNMKGSKIKNGYANHGDCLEYDEYVRWQKAVLLECWRLLTPTGVIFYNHKPRLQVGVLQTPLDLNPGLPVRQIIIWDRGSGVNFSQRFYVPRTEWIVVFAKPDFKLKNTAASAASDIWSLGPDSTSNPHPASFPVELAKKALDSVKGNVVLDPHCGSGTVGVACLATGKKFIGIDNSEIYASMSRRRLYLAEQGDFSSWRVEGA